MARQRGPLGLFSRSWSWRKIGGLNALGDEFGGGKTVTSDPGGLVAATLATLSQMPALERAMCASAFIAAVQGPDDRRISRVRWAAIAELKDAGMDIKEIADALGTTAEAIDLALQANGRRSSVSI
jgi:hypothetical protein